MGGTPRWFAPVILLPEETADINEVHRIFTEIGSACSEYGISVIGGHSEVTPGLDRLIIAGTMIGEVSKSNFVDKQSIQPGDVVYLAGGIAIEAVSIISREKQVQLQQHFSDTYIKEAYNYLFNPGICVLPAAETALSVCHPTGMHDPTEGGLTAGLWELAERAGCGFEIDADTVPVLDHCSELCRLFSLDPLKLIASGALLITVNPRDASPLETAFAAQGILISRIGIIAADKTHRIITDKGYVTHISQPIVDEIHKIWK